EGRDRLFRAAEPTAWVHGQPGVRGVVRPDNVSRTDAHDPDEARVAGTRRDLSAVSLVYRCDGGLLRPDQSPIVSRRLLDRLRRVCSCRRLSGRSASWPVSEAPSVDIARRVPKWLLYVSFLVVLA